MEKLTSWTNRKKPLDIDLSGSVLKKRVENLSKYKPTPHELQLVGKGANFAISPTEILVKEYVAQTELVCSNLPANEANILRAEIRGLLSNAKPSTYWTRSKTSNLLRKRSRSHMMW